MPTSTKHPDDLHDFILVNDTNTDVVLRILRTQGSESSILLTQRAQITLALQSGSQYDYAIERRDTRRLTVQIS